MARVFVGLSGGVDSAVSAALLKEDGHDVVGVFIKIWQPEFIECTWEKDRLDAMRVAAALNIPFKEIDLSDDYKKAVIADLIEGYKQGLTPNPDVWCNRVIKFGSFADWAFSKGAEKIATGHYARIEKEHGHHNLKRGVDHGKDQSYFLCRLAEADLEKIIFPVGGMKKSEVRAQAEKFNLPNAARPDSQGLCFVGDVTMSEFLSRYITLSKGKVLNPSGDVIGEHDGAALYTLGQRHGFALSVARASSQAQYCVAIDTKQNTITVSENRQDAAKKEFEVTNCTWVHQEPQLPLQGDVQVRYRETTAPGTILRDGHQMRVTLQEPRIAAPGQSAAFYHGDVLLGSGIVHSIGKKRL